MKKAFLFPGQGSQSVGMLLDAAGQWPVILKTFAEASDALGYDLWQVCRNGPESELNQTAVTQPAILTASVALWRQWFLSGGDRPDMVAGHSLGEYSALVTSESLGFTDAVRLVRLRGELMQDAVPEGQGKMAAILGLDDDQVIAACEEAANADVVSAVNFNSPGQVVIGGQAQAVDRAIEACKAAGAKKAMVLPMSVPSHCALMKDASEELREALENVTFNKSVIPVIQNVDASPHQESEELKANLVKQLYSPVLWTQCVKRLREMGAEATVECGPGRVLAGLGKRIDRDLKVLVIDSPQALDEALRFKG